MTDDLVKRIAALEAELAALKAKSEGQGIPEAMKGSKPWPKIDYTEGMSAPMSALKPMVDAFNPKGVKYDPNAFASARRSEPGGFGSPAGPSGASGPSGVPPVRGWVDAPDDLKAHHERFARIERLERERKEAERGK